MGESCYVWTDASFDPTNNVGAYGIVINYGDKEFVLSGSLGTPPASSEWCEFRALSIVAERLKSLRNKYEIKATNFTIYTDSDTVFRAVNGLIPPPRDSKIARQIKIVSDHFRTYSKKGWDIKVVNIPRKENKAHKIAYNKLWEMLWELDRQQQDIDSKISIKQTKTSADAKIANKNPAPTNEQKNEELTQKETKTTQATPEDIKEKQENEDEFIKLLAKIKQIYSEVATAKHMEFKFIFNREPGLSDWEIKFVTTDRNTETTKKTGGKIELVNHRVIEYKKLRDDT